MTGHAMQTIDSTQATKPATRIALWAFLLAAALILAAPLWAQADGNDAGLLSRQQLEAQLAAAERANRAQEVAAIRQRLQDGDFQVGDRLVVTVQGETFLTDTFAVRAGRVVTFPNLPDISLQGVLRHELTDHLTKEIGKYVRNPSVKATSLIRIAVSGEVTRPGYYSVPSDFLASDAIMAAGGPTPLAELKKTILRRGNSVLLDRAGMQKAIASGATLDKLDIRPGDEVVVGKKTQRNWQTIAYVAGSVLGLIGAIAALAN
jgi:protein involved in polysaccharide export with SLBB domain